MDSQSSFYVTCPSNSSLELFPKNTASNFTIKLPRSLYLRGNYEVALAEIHYPVSWKTFFKEDSYGLSIIDTLNDSAEYISLPVVYYESVPEFVASLNTELTAHFRANDLDLDNAKFKLDRLRQMIFAKVKEPYRLDLSEEVADALGFQSPSITGNIWGSHPYDINHGFNSLFVYCNICAPQIVGDSYVPLLRQVNLQGRRGSQVFKTYSEPHYVPVNSREVQNIEINIRDDTGAEVPFMFGKLTCKLHFRLKSL